MDKNDFNLQISLQGIETNSFSLLKPETVEEKPEKLSIGFSTNVKFDRNDEMLLFSLRIKVYEPQNPGNEFCGLNLIFSFKIMGLKKLDFENGMIAIPDSLMEIITSISVSTARGILFEKVSDTFLKGFILPIIDTKNLLPKSSK